MNKNSTINFNFGDKHKEYIRKARYSSMNVAEGAVRAGKTIDNVFAFAMELENTPDKIHLATGSTLANAKLNIAEANGFGLKYIFRGRSRMGKFEGYECIYINTATGEKVVVFAGGTKANSYEKIRGNSYGMWIATEINLHHENTIEECFNRTLMAENRKTFWDLNPSPPKHWIYVDYIDAYQKKSDNGELSSGYNFENFVIFDNINLTEDRKREIIETYKEDSVWYKRDILGMRIAVEGIIYKTFADNPDKFLIKREDLPIMRSIVMGVDFGGSKSKDAFVATGIDKDYNLYILASKKMEASNVNLGERYVDFLKEVEHKYGRVDYTYTDNAEQVGPNHMVAELNRQGLRRTVVDCIKVRINDRIRATDLLINQGRLYYTEDALEVRDSLANAQWDSTSDEDKRLDDHTSDIDTLDAFEYSFERDINNLVSYIKK